MPNPNSLALKFPRSQRSYGQTDMARSTRNAIFLNLNALY